MINLDFITASGEVILSYRTDFNWKIVSKEQVISGIVHLNKVIKCISELVYQTAVFFWYLNDFEGVDQCVSWRVNPNALRFGSQFGK
jgi:hypothetical protein